MKALTIKQPWAWAIVNGPKRIENRTWKPPLHIIGQRIAIHASARIDKAELLAYTELGAWLEPTVNTLPIGCIVGTAIVAGYSAMEGNRLVQQSKGAQGYNPYTDPWFFGPVGWLLTDVRKLDNPLPCKGALSLWDVPDVWLTHIGQQSTIFRNIIRYTRGMMDIDFTKLTKQQLRVFEQIAVNNDAGHSQKVLDNLEQHGYITSELQYLSGFPPVRVCRYSVPIAVHMQWCAWCATLPVGGNDSATNLG